MHGWRGMLCTGLVAAALADAGAAHAQAAAPAQTPAEPPAPSFPLGMGGPIAIDPSPPTVNLGPLLGQITINGALSGLVLGQDHPAAGDRKAWGDIPNGQLMISKSDGPVQFFVDVGAYAFPTLGAAYASASKTVSGDFGAVPVAYLKLAPAPNLSIEVGKLPTLLGAEYNFTFENGNIARGLLWGQENLVNRGVQVNYTAGPVAFALSVNDGFYSGDLSWVSGSATWSIDTSDTLAFAAAGNTRVSRRATTATPVLQDNAQVYNLVYTHLAGPWTIGPYLQYTRVPALAFLGTREAETWGGALLVAYAFPAAAKLGDLSLAGFSLPARAEYIASTGSAANGAANLLYGAGSRAWSLTLTPTYQYKIWYVRGEVSYVAADGAAPGLAFGPAGAARSQTRGLLEAGVLF